MIKKFFVDAACIKTTAVQLLSAVVCDRVVGINVYIQSGEKNKESIPNL